MADSDSSSDSDPEQVNYDSDRELQLAFSRGLLKPGLNVVETKPKSQVREKINNAVGMRTKLAEFSKASKLAWIERLDVTVTRPSTSTEEPKDQKSTDVNREDDFVREMSFYNQAQEAVKSGLKRLHKLSMPTKRPTDYLAEMAKTDHQMDKVRNRLMELKKAKERSAKAKMLREQRKFGKKTQVHILRERQKEKKLMLDAVKKHRKGYSNQLEDALENKPKTNAKSNAKVGKLSNNQYKKTKFGLGKRNAKYHKSNTSESSNTDNYYGKRKQTAGKGAQRPGKNKRKKMNVKK